MGTARGFGRGGGPLDAAQEEACAPEEIVARLRQVEVLTGQGTPVADAIWAIGVTEATYCRWRQEFGGLKPDQVRRLREIEAENTRLRKAVADLTPEKLILKEAASGACGVCRHGFSSSGRRQPAVAGADHAQVAAVGLWQRAALSTKSTAWPGRKHGLPDQAWLDHPVRR